jgi:hypothetical protein
MRLQAETTSSTLSMQKCKSIVFGHNPSLAASLFHTARRYAGVDVRAHEWPLAADGAAARVSSHGPKIDIDARIRGMWRVQYTVLVRVRFTVRRAVLIALRLPADLIEATGEKLINGFATRWYRLCICYRRSMMCMSMHGVRIIIEPMTWPRKRRRPCRQSPRRWQRRLPRRSGLALSTDIVFLIGIFCSQTAGCVC